MKLISFNGMGKTMIAITSLFFVSIACDNNDTKVKDLDIHLVADGFVSPIGVVASPDNSLICTGRVRFI